MPSYVPPGSLCLALFPEDELFYRAKVISWKNNQVEVIYVDYGNIETIPIQFLRKIREEHTKLPFQVCVEGRRERVGRKVEGRGSGWKSEEGRKKGKRSEGRGNERRCKREGGRGWTEEEKQGEKDGRQKREGRRIRGVKKKDLRGVKKKTGGGGRKEDSE